MHTHDIVAILDAIGRLTPLFAVMIAGIPGTVAAIVSWYNRIEIRKNTELTHQIATATDGLVAAGRQDAFMQGKEQGKDEAAVGGAEIIMRNNTAAQDSGEMKFRRRWTDKQEDAEAAAAVVVPTEKP